MKQSYFPKNGVWLKGNLHSHSTVSDGLITPSELAKLYADKGYDFLSMSDHNVFVPHNEFPEETIILLTGVEHDIEYSSDKCIHVVGTGVPGRKSTGYECRRYSKTEITDQELMDKMYKDGQFVTLAHPVWSRMEPEEILFLKNYNAVEVYNNGTEHLCHAGNAEVYWDLLLRHNHRVFATASDDVHNKGDLFGGWICVKASGRTKNDIFKSLSSGAFYASSGPEIYDFGMDGDSVYINCSPCREIHFVTYSPRGKSFFAGENQQLDRAVFELSGKEAYCRVVCVDFNGHSAWTQPIFFDN